MPVAYIPRACSLTAGRRALGCQANYICRRLNDLQTFACKSFAECRIMGLQAETECIGMDNTTGINAVDGHTDRKAMGKATESHKGKGETRSTRREADRRCSHGWPKVMLEYLEVKCMERLKAWSKGELRHWAIEAAMRRLWRMAIERGMVRR